MRILRCTRAKLNGKSGYAVFDPTMNDHVAERLEIETGFHFALERGELSLNYQPLICLKIQAHGWCRGFATLGALPMHGLIPPGKVYTDRRGRRIDRSDRLLGPGTGVSPDETVGRFDYGHRSR